MLKFIIPALLLSLQANANYSLLSEIPVSSDGGWDYLNIDSASHRLFVSHGDRVVVIDLKTNKIVGEIQDTPGVHGIALAPELGRAFTSNGKEGKVSILDLKSLALMQKVSVGQNPDAILYNPEEQEVYAFNGKSQSATVINGKTGAVLATIPLSGKPEFAAADAKNGKIFVNIEDKNTITVIEAKTHRVVSNWPIAPGEEASGMAIDTAHHRLFIGCHNKQMLMIDAVTGKVLDQVAIGAGVDANWYDPGTHLAFSSNSEGSVTIARVTEKRKFQLVQNLSTRPRARTMALDPISHKIYLPSADFAPAKIPGDRPQPVPGTFKILVYGEAKN